MKKVIVLNRLEATVPKTCCNLLKKVDGFDHRNSEKMFLEKSITDKFNAISEKGFEFEDGKVYGHNLYVENAYVNKGNHGVYRFKNSDSKKNYSFYFGPLIKIDEKQLGCGSLGCKTKGLGCKGGGKGLGCKGGGKGLGCKSRGGDNKQYLNFFNNENNEEEVKIFNTHFGLRKSFNKKDDDYLYDSKESIYINLNEYVKDNYDQLLNQFQTDIASFESKGLCFDSLIDVPSYTNMYSQGILFSNNSNTPITLADKDLEVEGFDLFLSRFDLWYFPKIKGLFEQLMEILYLIPVIGWILKLIFGKDEKQITGTDIISNANIEKLEAVYEKDFNDQESREKRYKDEYDKLNEMFLSKIPVTIAVKAKMVWYDKLLHPQKYDFYTFFANGIKK